MPDARGHEEGVFADVVPCKCCGYRKVEERADQLDDGTAHIIFYLQCLRCLIRTHGAFNRSDARRQWNTCMDPTRTLDQAKEGE